MEKLLLEVGKIFNIFLINIIKKVPLYPYHIYYDFNNKLFIDEIENVSLESAIVQGIEKFEATQESVAQSAFIMPADLVENGVKKAGFAAFCYESLQEQELIITLSYSIDKGIVTIENYQVEDYNNITPGELQKLEKFFLKGLLNNNQEFWIEQIKNKIKAQ